MVYLLRAQAFKPIPRHISGGRFVGDRVAGVDEVVEDDRQDARRVERCDFVSLIPSIVLTFSPQTQ